MVSRRGLPVAGERAADGARVRAADGAPAREEKRTTRGLSRGAERVARAVMEALLADEDAEGRLVAGPAEACERGVTWLSLSTGQSSGDVRRGFGVLAFCLQWLPLLVIGAPRRMTSLPLAERIRYLEALERSRIGLLAMLLLAFKVPMSIAAFEAGEELRSTGFDRVDTTARRGGWT